jgi:exodeoxyribonuclease VII large subunit
MLITRITERRQRVTDHLLRADRIVERRLDQLRARLSAFDVSLRATPTRIKTQTERAGDRLKGLALRAESALAGDLSRRRALVQAQDRMLQSLSYRNVLKRGYALVRDEDGAPVKGAASLGPGRAIAIEFNDGTVDAVTGSGGGAPRRKVAKTEAVEAAKPATRQGSLF